MATQTNTLIENLVCYRLQHTKKQLVTKEKSSRDSQKAYNKDQSVVEGLHKELSAIEVGVVYAVVIFLHVLSR